MEVAGLLLAAGGGRRYGMPKALVRHEGDLLVERAVRILADAGCTPLVVVLGAAADRVRAAARLSGADTVDNTAWATGLGSSLRTGLERLAGTTATAVVVLLVDMPGVTVPAVRRVAAGATAASLVVAGYHGRPGHPVLLGREHWAGVARLATGDTGARPYLRAHAGQVRTVPCADVADDTDLDTPADAAGPVGPRA